jgi:hypothetical protein
MIRVKHSSSAGRKWLADSIRIYAGASLNPEFACSRLMCLVDESDERSPGRHRSLPYLPPPPKSHDDLPEIRLPRDSPPPPSLSALIPGTSPEPDASPAPGEIGRSGRAALVLILLSLLAAAAYLAFSSSA